MACQVFVLVVDDHRQMPCVFEMAGRSYCVVRQAKRDSDLLFLFPRPLNLIFEFDAAQ